MVNDKRKSGIGECFQAPDSSTSPLPWASNAAVMINLPLRTSSDFVSSKISSVPDGITSY